ncbi:GIY-YIG nuclease family protein [Virgibacillus necropolis]|uniref:Endonuclease n=1 Tax=Virgibacillus necropolis TaxID=163877 RepID=A0A221M7W7_9BACI|nr:GIY-YIG nuclease family protein [Virgibacillus necropolis]ASN03756.1 endonuclease [Virgibacillus necropolis]
MEENNHVVYILKCKDTTLYTGYTNDLANRLHMHESGKGAKYTRGRGPFQVEYVEQFQTKEEALKREYAIKQLKRSEKEHLISLKKQEVGQNEDAKKL